MGYSGKRPPGEDMKNFGCKESVETIAELKAKIVAKDHLIADLRAACRRISAAPSIESRNRIANQCYYLFSVKTIREANQSEQNIETQKEPTQ